MVIWGQDVGVQQQTQSEQRCRTLQSSWSKPLHSLIAYCTACDTGWNAVHASGSASSPSTVKLGHSLMVVMKNGK